MTFYSLGLAFMFRFDNCIFEMLFFSMNVVFFTMEMKYILCNELILNIAEVGSVEIESFFAVLFILSAVYGSSIFEMTLGKTFSFTSDSFIGANYLSGLVWKYIIGVILFSL